MIWIRSPCAAVNSNDERLDENRQESSKFLFASAMHRDAGVVARVERAHDRRGRYHVPQTRSGPSTAGSLSGMAELDHVKAINDALGQGVGDRVITAPTAISHERGKRRRAQGTATMVTVPVEPSISIVAPSGIRLVASITDTAHGRPSSRHMIAA